MSTDTTVPWWSTATRLEHINRKDRSPERITSQTKVSEQERGHTISSSDSSFSSSFFSSSFSAASVGAPPVAPPPPPTDCAGPPPPEPTFDSSSFTFLPSRAFVSNAAQIGSSSTLAADVRARILSACRFKIGGRSLRLTESSGPGELDVR